MLGPVLGNGRIRRFVHVLVFANLDLVRRAALIPGVRCSLAGTLYQVSPRISGFAYRHFNLSLLSALWLAVLGALYAISAGVFR
jgi:hypothetical protein